MISPAAHGGGGYATRIGDGGRRRAGVVADVGQWRCGDCGHEARCCSVAKMVVPWVAVKVVTMVGVRWLWAAVRTMDGGLRECIIGLFFQNRYNRT